jgi:hypothetical protein
VDWEILYKQLKLEYDQLKYTLGLTIAENQRLEQKLNKLLPQDDNCGDYDCSWPDEEWDESCDSYPFIY